MVCASLQHATANKCYAIAPGFATFACAKPPANVIYLQNVVCNAWLEEIAADPSEENVFSVKTLLSNGFKKKADGDYRKEIKQNGKQADNTGME